MKKCISRFALFLGIFVASLASQAQQRQRVAPTGPDTPPVEIVGGQGTTISQLPWQVLLGTPNGNCGGSIVGTRWILTAAHCVFNTATSSLHAYAGVTYVSQKNTGQVLGIDAIYINPNYTHPSNSSLVNTNDIALLHTTSDIVLGPNAQIINLATPATDNAGIGQGMATASGWGDLSIFGPTPDQLQSVDMPVANIATVGTYYNTNYGITNVNDANNMLGVGYSSGGTAGCYGDSGGPLMARDLNGTPYLIGVENAGFCNTYTIFARVSRFATWISDYLTQGIAINANFASCSTVNLSLTKPVGSPNAITWSASPATAITNYTVVGNTYAANVAPGFAGYVTFTALLASASTPITRQLYVGGPAPITGSYYNNNTYTLSSFQYVQGGTLSVTINPTPNTTYAFSCTSPFTQTGPTTGYFQLNYPATNVQRAQLTVTSSGPCGAGWNLFDFYVPSHRTYALWPNPATSEIIVTEGPSPAAGAEKLGQDAPASPFEARLYDSFGNKVSVQTSTSGKVRLDVRALPAGLYTLRVGEGAGAISKLVQIQH